MGFSHHVGVPGFLDNLGDLYAQVDEGDSGQWTAFLHAWLATYGERLMAVAELTDDLLVEGSALRDVLPDDLADTLPTRDSEYRTLSPQARACAPPARRASLW